MAKMRAPDYREAACCTNCWHYASLPDRCTKHGGKVDWLHVCANFISQKEKEQNR
jgi:hypothetical protein